MFYIEHTLSDEELTSQHALAETTFVDGLKKG